MIQVLEEGRYKELDGFVDQWFLQMEKNGQQADKGILL